jgi:hypothetical protein
MATPSRVSRLLWLSAQVACLAALVPFAGAAASSAQMHPEAAALNPSWTMDEPGLGTWETCDTCDQCVLDAVPGGVPPPKPPPGADGKVHCTKCLGCSVILRRLKSSTPMLGKDVKVFTGASGAAVMKGVTADKGEVFVKTWCGLKGGYRQTPRNHPIPETCDKDGDHLPETERLSCGERGGVFGWSECNFKFLNALDAMALDANLSLATPRSWTEEIRAFLPVGGYGDGPDAGEPDPSAGAKIENVKAQFYEPAPGVAVEAFFSEGASTRVLDLAKRIRHEDIVRCAVFDLLFSEQDRHGQNVFVSEEGRVVVLDNEGSFGPINSMLLPGGQKFEVYRIGYNAVCCGNLPGGKAKNCPGTPSETSAPEVWVDYRCHAPGRFVGTGLPPGVEPFLRRVAAMEDKEVFEHYGMAHRKHASALKQRVDDLLDGGFERALLLAYSRQRRGNGEDYGNDFYYGVAPPCCATEEGACKIRGAEGRESHGEVWAGNGAGAEALALWKEGEVKMPKNAEEENVKNAGGENGRGGDEDADAETARRRRARRRATSRRLFSV